MRGGGGEIAYFCPWVICFWPVFLKPRLDERIGLVAKWMDGRMTGEKGFAQGAYFLCA